MSHWNISHKWCCYKFDALWEENLLMILSEKNKLNIIAATLHPDIQQHESLNSERKKVSIFTHNVSEAQRQ